MSDKLHIRKGRETDLNELELLYNELNDYLALTLNYPGYLKDIYPVRDTALIALQEGSLFVAMQNGIVVGSVILNHQPEKAYSQIKWLVNANYNEILVLRTLVVHPSFMKNGIATALIKFAREYAINKQMKSIRLDVTINNIPAIKLYKKMGYQFISTVDLGLPYEHLKWFDVFELVL